MNIVYSMDIPIVSTISNPCSAISFESNGDSRYALGGSYDKYIFGTYRFASIDPRGNNIYHANIHDRDSFLFKNLLNYWVVGITHL